MMTGGVTGVPKAAVLTHFNCVANATQCKLWLYDRRPGMALVGVLPFYHSFAITVVMNGTIAIGLFMLLWPRPPEMHVLVEELLKYGPKGGIICPGVEVLFIPVWSIPQGASEMKPKIAGMFRSCISGAGPLHCPVKEMFEEFTGAHFGRRVWFGRSDPRR